MFIPARSHARFSVLLAKIGDSPLASTRLSKIGDDIAIRPYLWAPYGQGTELRTSEEAFDRMHVAIRGTNPGVGISCSE
jgi:hypothetical protein